VVAIGINSISVIESADNNPEGFRKATVFSKLTENKNGSGPAGPVGLMRRAALEAHPDDNPAARDTLKARSAWGRSLNFDARAWTTCSKT
jgi:hypothetical protein